MNVFTRNYAEIVLDNSKSILLMISKSMCEWALCNDFKHIY